MATSCRAVAIEAERAPEVMQGKLLVAQMSKWGPRSRSRRQAKVHFYFVTNRPQRAAMERRQEAGPGRRAEGGFEGQVQSLAGILSARGSHGGSGAAEPQVPPLFGGQAGKEGTGDRPGDRQVAEREKGERVRYFWNGFMASVVNVCPD